MGLYCLMAAGSYGGDYDHPETPTQMCAWSKEELGLLTPKEIVCDETVALYYQGDARRGGQAVARRRLLAPTSGSWSRTASARSGTGTCSAPASSSRTSTTTC